MPRITFILVSVLVSATALLSSAVRGTATEDTAQGLRVRRDIRDVEKAPDELKNLRHAFFMLKKQKPTCADPAAKSEYDCWAAYHNNFTDYGCQHFNDRFWPWHRHHLSEFEKAMRSSDPDHPERVANVTLPYWDWSQPPSGKNFPASLEAQFLKPGEFYSEDCPDPEKCVNPLWADGRRTEATCQSITEGCVRETLDLTTWAAFGGGPANAISDFESQAHNYMHFNYIGGLMAQPQTAAQDSIYWLFHSFIDRVWDQWQQRHQKDPCSADNVPNPTRRLTRGLWPPPSVQFKDALCAKALGYQYADAQPFAAALANCPPANSLCQTAAPETIVAAATAITAQGISSAELIVEGLTIPADFSYSTWVLVHPASRRYRAKDREFAARYVAKTFAAWQAGDHTAHAGEESLAGGMRVRANLTAAIQALAQSGERGPLAVTFVFTAPRKSERAAPLVFGKDVDFRTARIDVEKDGKSSQIVLQVRR